MAHQGQCAGQVSLSLANLDFQGLTRFLSQGLLNSITKHLAIRRSWVHV